MGFEFQIQKLRLQYSRINAFFTNGFAKRTKEIECSVFHSTLSFMMNEQRTLLGLFWRMLTHFYQRFNNMFEGIEIIIKHDQVHQVGGLCHLHHVH